MMQDQTTRVPWKPFTLRIILPVTMAIVLYLGAFFLIMIPAIQKDSIAHKKEMIRELTHSAWNILASFEYDEQKGLLTRDEAKMMALEQIGNLHYGQGMKDYFWINDMHPRMLIHPYRSDLIGKDMSGFTDPDGKKVFLEFVSTVRSQGEGFVTYRWQWMDNRDKILPKISYVKGFTPWGWIIGTGIYIDDINREINTLRMWLVEISIGILVIITILLSSIIRHTYTTMLQKQKAEEALKKSEVKFRTLVESAADGMFMALDGKFIYANYSITRILGYSPEEFTGIPVTALFTHDNSAGLMYLESLIAGNEAPEHFETRVVSRDGTFRDVILSSTPVQLNDQSGFMTVVTDITVRKQAEDALNASEEKFRTIANNLNVAIFRRTLGNNPKFVEVNPALITLLGYRSRSELADKPLALFIDMSDSEHFLTDKNPAGTPHKTLLTMVRKDGSRFTASLREIDTADAGKNRQFRDGIIEDVTGLKEREHEYNKNISEMQAALSFFNQQLSSLPAETPEQIAIDTPLTTAIGVMEQTQVDVLLITDTQQMPAGVITNRDLRKTAQILQQNARSTVATIMSSPVILLPGNASVFEAWSIMREHGISHLFITSPEGDISGLLHIKDIVPIRTSSPAVLLEEIKRATTCEDVISSSSVLPFHIAHLIENGIIPQRVNHFSSAIADTILIRIIELMVQKLGPPPAPFSFIVFGSAGRQEQTLLTDQDNAIIFADVTPHEKDAVSSYFLALGDAVCTMLDSAGYRFCKGGNMANNPKWCRSYSEWLDYFSRWTTQAAPEDLLNVKIFFDFRHVYGDNTLPLQLRHHINTHIPGNNRFFQLLTRDVLPWTPPVGFFGNILVETIDDNRKVFDIKSAMQPIVDYARIYALQHALPSTNTVERIDLLAQRGIINAPTHREIVQAYTYCMQIRLREQARSIASGSKNPDNFIDPRTLTDIERKLLREIFSQIRSFQSGLSYEFTGQTGGI